MFRYETCRVFNLDLKRWFLTSFDLYCLMNRPQLKSSQRWLLFLQNGFLSLLVTFVTRQNTLNPGVKAPKGIIPIHTIPSSMPWKETSCPNIHQSCFNLSFFGNNNPGFLGFNMGIKILNIFISLLKFIIEEIGYIISKISPVDHDGEAISKTFNSLMTQLYT